MKWPWSESDTDAEARLARRTASEDRLRELASRLGVKPLSESDNGFRSFRTWDGEDYDAVRLMLALLDRIDAAEKRHAA
jgi:hypothetical protein